MTTATDGEILAFMPSDLASRAAHKGFPCFVEPLILVHRYFEFWILVYGHLGVAISPHRLLAPSIRFYRVSDGPIPCARSVAPPIRASRSQPAPIRSDRSAPPRIPPRLN